MVFALGILIHQGQFGNAAGQHIKIVFAEDGGFDGCGGSDGQPVNSVNGGRLCGSLRSRGRGFLCRASYLLTKRQA